MAKLRIVCGSAGGVTAVPLHRRDVVLCDPHLRTAAVGAKVAARAAAETHDALPAAAAAAGAGVVRGAEAIPGAAVVALQHTWVHVTWSVEERKQEARPAQFLRLFRVKS